MDRREIQTILQNEGLKYYNLFLDHPIRPWEVVICQEADRWVVCAADERAAIAETSCRYFSREQEALECFLALVRLEKILPPKP